MHFYFISHPNVQISADVPVPQWPLSELGRRRMRAGLQQPWVAGLSAVHSSCERKALDSAEILAGHLGLPVHTHEALGENDHSATGFLPPAEFERVADEFFARPEQSVRGWETAAAAVPLPSCRTVPSAPCSTAIWRVCPSRAAGISRPTAAATTSASS